MKPPEALADAFRARGLKVTPQRECVFRLLHGTDAHPTAEAVHAAARSELPTISLRTVYQTLNDLAAMGEIQQIDAGTGSARFDPNVGPHHHLVCDACGDVRDVCARFAGLDVPDDQRQGFTIGTAEIMFRGRCARCTTLDPQTTTKRGRTPHA